MLEHTAREIAKRAHEEGRLSVQEARDLLAEFGAERLSQLSPFAREAFVRRISELHPVKETA